MMKPVIKRLLILMALSMPMCVSFVFGVAWLLDAPATSVAAWWSLLWIAGEAARRSM